MKNHISKVFVLVTLTVAFLAYSIHLYTQKVVEIAPAETLAQEGKILWQDKNCTACHQLYGLGGHLGPDLTNVYENRPVEYIEAFLRSGTYVMPNFNLSEHEIKAFVAFLKYTNLTGTADPTTFKKHINGTISQQ